jgi:hypothetical protein
LACCEEKIHHEVEKVEEGSQKKGPEGKNFFDFFDVAVKILPNVAVSRNIRQCRGGD